MIAVIITIMVLELKVPHGTDWRALRPLTPVFLSYVLSFVYLGIYWSNHYRLLQAVRYVNGRILWANMHLLFWLSLVPVGDGLDRERICRGTGRLVRRRTAACCVRILILTRSLIAAEGNNSPLAAAVGRDVKGKISVVIWAVAILVSFVTPSIAFALYSLVASIWLLPDRRLDKALEAGT